MLSHSHAEIGALPAERYWVRLILPGITDPTVRFEAPIGGLLSKAVSTAIADTQLNTIDCISYPGTTQQEYLFSGWVNSRISKRDGIADSSRITDRCDSLRAEGSKPCPALLGAAFEDVIPDRIGLAIVKLDMDPVGSVPIQTERLVSTTTDPIDLGLESTRSAFATYVHDLAQQGQPHLTRTQITETTLDAYQVTQQVAQFGQSRQRLYADEQIRVLSSSPSAPLGAAYEPAALTSSWSRGAAVDQTLRPTGDGLQACHGMPVVVDGDREGHPRMAHLHALCQDEYAQLCRRAGNTAALRGAYDWLDVCPTPLIETSSLTGVLGLVPNYEFGTWFDDCALPRAQPNIETLLSVREATGTESGDMATGPSSPHGMPTASDAVSSDQCSTPSSDLVQQAIRICREHGDTISTESCLPEATFTRTTPENRSEPVIVGTADTLLPGDCVMAANRLRSDQGLTFITESKADARWIHDVFRQPFAKAGDVKTALYPCSTAYWAFGDLVALRPAGESVDWVVEPNGELTVALDGTPVATGTTSNLPSDPGMPVLRSCKESDHYSVYHPERGLLETAPSVDVLFDSYQPIRLPAIPRWLTALDVVTVFVVNDGTATRITPTLPEATGTLGWRAALKKFLEIYTCQSRSEWLRANSIINRFRGYLSAHTTQRQPSNRQLQRLLSTCWEALPSQQEDRERGKLILELGGRTWRYPLNAGDSRPVLEPDPQTVSLAY